MRPTSNTLMGLRWKIILLDSRGFTIAEQRADCSYDDAVKYADMLKESKGADSYKIERR